jgi:hypothetical protein
MSCVDYLPALATFAAPLAVARHNNVQEPISTARSAGATIRVQTDQGTFNLVPVPGLAFPGPGGLLGDFLAGQAASTYTTWLPGGAGGSDSWQEEWVVRDPATFADPPTLQLWSKVSGDLLDDAELAVLRAEALAQGLGYQRATMTFSYKKVPSTQQINAAPAPVACLPFRAAFALWPVVDHKVGLVPTAALLREDVPGTGRRVDHWLLGSGWRPPAGTAQALWVRASAAPLSLKAWLLSYFPAAGAGAFGSQNKRADSRYVQVQYSLEAL